MSQEGRAVMKKQFGQMAAEHMVACDCEKTIKSESVKSGRSVRWLIFAARREISVRLEK